MSSSEHVRVLRAGKREWRQWRKTSKERPILRNENLSGLDLSSLDFSGADMRHTILSQSNLYRSKLIGTDLSGCVARFARFSSSNLTDAKLIEADLRAASFRRADLRGADFTRAVLRFSSLSSAEVEGAKFNSAEVFGIGAWNLKGEPAQQKSLVIREKEGMVGTTVDDLETAQLLFLFRENSKIADVINTASLRTVLLLGRFSPPYSQILEGLRKHLLEMNFVPVIFNFDRPSGRDLTETVASLAHMACFVIPDLSGAKSVPQELSHIVPFLPSVPVVPIIAEKNEGVYSMFEHFLRYPWVHAPLRYRDLDHLLKIVDTQVIEVAFKAAMASRGIKDAKLPAPATQRRKRARKS